MRSLLAGRLKGALVLLLILGSCAVSAHDSITSEVRGNYLRQLLEAQAALGSSNSPQVRAKASFQIGSTLDEIRDLFNQDIISHGIIRGFESSILLNELVRAGHKLVISPRTGLYLSQLQHYQDAIRLDPRSSYVDRARFLLFKSHFYDSFGDNPMQPFSQSREELLAMIAIGEGLTTLKEPSISAEEVGFILAIHYLQAIKQKAIERESAMKRFSKLLQDLRRDYPQSLKPLTLEALIP